MFVKRLKEIEKAFAAITNLREVLERGDSMERLAMKAKALERQVAELEAKRDSLASDVAAVEADLVSKRDSAHKMHQESIAALDAEFGAFARDTQKKADALQAQHDKAEAAHSERMAAMKRREQELRESVEKAERMRQRAVERLSA